MKAWRSLPSAFRKYQHRVDGRLVRRILRALANRAVGYSDYPPSLRFLFQWIGGLNLRYDARLGDTEPADEIFILERGFCERS